METRKNIILAAKRSLYKKSLYEFFKAAAPKLEPSVKWDFVWFYEYLCDVLQKEVERINRNDPKKQNLIFNLPFRSGKSTLISQVLPVWCWIVNPSFKIMSISANQDLANRHAEKSLILIQSNWFQQLYGDSFKLVGDAVSEYSNDRAGVRMSFGMNANDITGSGAMIVCMDDPQTVDTITPTGIKNTINKYNDKIYSRLNDPKVHIHILVQQRLHQQDLSGYLLKEKNVDQEYKHISIPVVINDMINPPELKQHYTNGYLWLPRFDEEQLRKYKKNLGSRAYASQLLMKPQDDEGNLIKEKWFETVTADQFKAFMDNEIEQSRLNKKLINFPPPHFILDTATTEKKSNDPTALLSYYIYGNRAYVFDVKTAYLNPSALNTWVINTVIKNGYTSGSMIKVESAMTGIALISHLKNNGYRVIDLGKPNKDKVWRVNQCLPEWEGGKIVFIEGTYLQSFVEELIGFPETSPHDDQVDCLTYLTETEFLKKTKLTYASA